MIIRSSRVLTERGLEPGTVHITGGTIARLGAFEDVAGDEHVLNAGNTVVMPGLVDTHVHVNEPGRTHWEGFATATRAAAAGGVTTMFDMPLNSIPATITVAALEAKRASAARHAGVNVGFIGGVVPGNVGELSALHAEGVSLFKCFLTPSGVDEFTCVSEADLRLAMPVLAQLDATLMVHAELPEHLNGNPAGDHRAYRTYLASRPPSAETEAIALIVRLAQEFGTRVHIVHVSSPASLEVIGEARARGVRITCETCPHYLAFCAESIKNGATEFKCAPPIRSDAERDMLWQAVLDGRIDMIVSDHSPCPPELKEPGRGDFFTAWGGIASLQLGLPAVWTEGRSRGLSVELLCDRMCRAPARLAGLASKKGQLAEGYDADIVIWDPDASFVVDSDKLCHRHPVTPYHDRHLFGRVRATLVNGQMSFRDGASLNEHAGVLFP